MKKIYLENEANRCLLCKNPRCRKNCPIDTPIPEVTFTPVPSIGPSAILD